MQDKSMIEIIQAIFFKPFKVFFVYSTQHFVKMDLEKKVKIETNLNNEACHVILKLFTPALTQP